ncbi:MAG: GFA family protein [Rhodobacteraceae bacterium]|nr:GFA family protein [Paracoccaceae bacterium]
MAEGGCPCGAVTRRPARLNGPMLVRHCGQCRTQSGHFVAPAPVRTDLTKKGEPRWYSASAFARRGAAGTLEAPTGLQLMPHMHYGDKGDYYRATDRLACYDEWKDSTEITP